MRAQAYNTSGVNLNRTQIVSELAIGASTYWTTIDGRSRGAVGYVLERRKKRDNRF
jgi:ribosomal protein S4E